ncbi:MAG: cytochrome P450 [Pseudoruegeria sp.]
MNRQINLHEETEIVPTEKARSFDEVPSLRQSIFKPVEHSIEALANMNNAPFAAMKPLLPFKALMPFKVVFVRDPEVLEEIYSHPKVGVQKPPFALSRVRSLMSGGTFISSGLDRSWLHRRAMSGPPLLRLNNLPDLMQEIEKVIECRNEVHFPTDKPIDLADATRRHITDVTFRLFFSVELDENDLSEIAHWTEVLENEFPKTMPQWLPTPGNTRFRHASARFSKFVDQLIAQRRITKPKKPDSLSPLFEKEDPKLGRMWTDVEIRDEFFSHYFGASAMATPISWVLYILAIDAALLRRVQAEIDGVEQLDVSTIDALPILNAVLEEVTRLYPTFWGSLRYSADSVILGGHQFPEKTMFVLLRFLAQRHPKYWTNPEAFDIDRFLDETSSNQHPAAKFEYGRGQRICIGQRVSPLIIKTSLAKILRNREPILKNSDARLPSPRFGFGTYLDTPVSITMRPR